MTGRMLMTALVAAVLWAWLPMPAGAPGRTQPWMAGAIGQALTPCALPTDCARRIDGRYAASARAMAQAGAPYDGWAGRRFLGFDPLGDGQAAEVLGDLATADRITVLIPGVATTLGDFDRGLGGVTRRAPSVQARQIHDAALARDPDAKIAVIAWLGYNAPDGLGVAAAREEVARSGARALNTLLAGLAAVRPRASVLLVGHSYGAVVAGLAGPGAGNVTDVVALGAPGMGVQHATDLPPGVRVWAARAEADWIGRVPQVRLLGFGHGRHPASPEFGALPLPTDPATVHDAYLTDGSPTLPAVAALALPQRQAARA